MRLTNYTDYTLRTLIYLALITDRLVTIAEISEHYGISEAHLNKVVHQLGLAGDIETARGKGAGFGWPGRRCHPRRANSSQV